VTDIDFTTPEGRAELRKLVERATPTPWATKREQTQYGHVTHVLSTRESELRPGLTGQEVIAANAAGFDAELIAAAVNALPALLDAAEKLERATEDAHDHWQAAANQVVTRYLARAEAAEAALDRVRALSEEGKGWGGSDAIEEFILRLDEILDGAQ